MNRDFEDIRTVCVIVAHPDDETLWTGGMILMHPEWECKVFSYVVLQIRIVRQSFIRL